jgi:hypothetical protein
MLLCSSFVGSGARPAPDLAATLCSKLDFPEPLRPNIMWCRLFFALSRTPGVGSTKYLTLSPVARVDSSMSLLSLRTASLSIGYAVDIEPRINPTGAPQNTVIRNHKHRLIRLPVRESVAVVGCQLFDGMHMLAIRARLIGSFSTEVRPFEPTRPGPPALSRDELRYSSSHEQQTAANGRDRSPDPECSLSKLATTIRTTRFRHLAPHRFRFAGPARPCR